MVSGAPGTLGASGRAAVHAIALVVPIAACAAGLRVRRRRSDAAYGPVVARLQAIEREVSPSD